MKRMSLNRYGSTRVFARPAVSALHGAADESDAGGTLEVVDRCRVGVDPGERWRLQMEILAKQIERRRDRQRQADARRSRLGALRKKGRTSECSKRRGTSGGTQEPAPGQQRRRVPVAGVAHRGGIRRGSSQLPGDDPVDPHIARSSLPQEEPTGDNCAPHRLACQRTSSPPANDQAPAGRARFDEPAGDLSGPLGKPDALTTRESNRPLIAPKVHTARLDRAPISARSTTYDQSAPSTGMTPPLPDGMAQHYSRPHRPLPRPRTSNLGRRNASSKRAAPCVPASRACGREQTLHVALAGRRVRSDRRIRRARSRDGQRERRVPNARALCPGGRRYRVHALGPKCSGPGSPHDALLPAPYSAACGIRHRHMPGSPLEAGRPTAVSVCPVAEHATERPEKRQRHRARRHLRSACTRQLRR